MFCLRAGIMLKCFSLSRDRANSQRSPVMNNLTTETGPLAALTCCECSRRRDGVAISAHLSYL
jgi:hypothetical protein